ncbi:MAG: serine/threonine protein kinase [Gemmatimonadales bacterium]
MNRWRVSRDTELDAAEAEAEARWVIGPSPGRELESLARRELGELFEIRAVLGRGRSSVLLDARELETDRRVALRVMHRSALTDAGLGERLVRAVADWASLDHPNVVAVQRSGSSAKLFWYAMEFVEGASLATLLRDHGPLDFRQTVRAMEQAASALHYAHGRGVVHGDVHPANIFLFGPGWVLLADVAVGRVLDRLPAGGAEAEVTRPVYTAPEEETTDLPPSPAADQYALALTMWECLTGLPPGGQERDGELPARLTELRPDVPPHAAEALGRALNPRPSARFPGVRELVAALGIVPPAASLEPPPRTAAPSTASQRLLFVEYPRRKRPPRLLALAVLTVIAVTLLFAAPWKRTDAERYAAPVPILAPQTEESERVARREAQSPRPREEPRQEPGDEAALSTAETDFEPDPVEETPVVERRAPRPSPRRSAGANGGRSDRSVPPAAQRDSAIVAPPPAATAPPAPPGQLFISTRPWGQLFVDGQLIGNTPVARLPLQAGLHQIRVVRPGFRPYEREVRIEAGQEMRLIDLVLEVLPP